jgi:hypothetical protein
MTRTRTRTRTSRARTGPAVDDAELREALAPVREALCSRAAAVAGRSRAEVELAAEALLRDARAEVDGWVADARRRGAEDAALAVAATRAAADREAREVVLAARRAAYGELLRRVRDAARDAGGDPDRRDRRDRLVRLARAELGPEADVRVSPDGIVAEAGGRRVEWSFDELAARAVGELGTEVERLWAP